MEDLADCVPDQEGWVFGRRAAAKGMAYMAFKAAGLAAAAKLHAGPFNSLATSLISIYCS
jgi:hypothetical protein